MTRSVANALKAVAVLVCITAVCVAILTVCNMYFPKYVPTLDAATAQKINSICPTGKDDATAFDDGYIVMLNDADYGADMAAYNKAHKSTKAKILAVYGEPKGINAGAYVIESSAPGHVDDVVILTAFVDGTVVGAMAKKQMESYWKKLPADIFDSLKGQRGDLQLDAVTGATHTRDAITNAAALAGNYALEYNSAIRTALSAMAKEASA